MRDVEAFPMGLAHRRGHAGAAGNRRKTWVRTEKTDGAESKELVATDVTGRRSRTPLPHLDIP